jgi:23S rRNA (uracil-5-)-methyltransferase RumA
MARTNKRPRQDGPLVGEVFELEITDLAFGGAGIARKADLVVFVNGGLPEQTVKAVITNQKKNWLDARVTEVVKHSAWETFPDEYQQVPGCPWGRMPLAMQHEYKKKQVFGLFKRFVKIDLESVFDEFVSSPRTWDYRNKMEFSFGFNIHQEFCLGSKSRGQFELVEQAEKPSGMFDAEFEKLLPEIRDICAKLMPSTLKLFQLLRVRKSHFENKFLVELETEEMEGIPFNPMVLGEFLQEKLGDQLGGYLIRNGKRGRRILVLGKESFIEKLGALSFEVSIDAFFQPNVFSAEKLYAKTLEYADLKGGEKVWDLFCGTGTIAQFMAKQNPTCLVTGVELIPSAVANARENATRNEIKNVEFSCDDVHKFCSRYQDQSVDVIILDPPRAGVAKKSWKYILGTKPKKLVYVSCNPATMVRDTEILIGSGYVLKRFALVDQFPHTSHVEGVGEFVLQAK